MTVLSETFDPDFLTHPAVGDDPVGETPDLRQPTPPLLRDLNAMALVHDLLLEEPPSEARDDALASIRAMANYVGVTLDREMFRRLDAAVGLPS